MKRIVKGKIILLLMAVSGFTSFSLASENQGEEDSALLDSIVTYRTVIPTDDTIRDYKTEYQYDEYGNKIWEIKYYWDFQHDKWNNGWKYKYNYDNNALTSEFEYQWDSYNSIWKNPDKTEYFYDEKGNQTEIVFYIDQWNSGHLEKDTRSINIYDSDNNCILNEGYSWDDGLNDWKIWSKRENAYDTHHNCILRKTHVVDLETDELIKYDSIIYRFNENDEQTLYTQFLWMDDTNRWRSSHKSESAYRNNGRTDTLSYWSSDGWKYTSKFDNTYDENGNVLTIKEYEWNISLNDWFQIEESVYTYTSMNYLLKKETYNRYYVGRDWKITQIVKYYYATAISGISNPGIDNFSEISVWPNPTDGTFYINSRDVLEISIMNSSGQVIQNKILNESLNQINLGNVAKGIYFIHITNSDRTQRWIRKVVVY